jgi:hypothetical protein
MAGVMIGVDPHKASQPFGEGNPGRGRGQPAVRPGDELAAPASRATSCWVWVWTHVTRACTGTSADSPSAVSR